MIFEKFLRGLGMSQFLAILEYFFPKFLKNFWGIHGGIDYFTYGIIFFILRFY